MSDCPVQKVGSGAESVFQVRLVLQLSSKVIKNAASARPKIVVEKQCQKSTVS